MKKINLSIPEPCHENWDGMTPKEKGRFCGSCQKTVVDFTAMNDRQIAEFFKRPQGSVCGRFSREQLDKDFIVPRKHIPWIRYFFQFAIPAFLVSMKAGAQGKVMVHDTTTVQVKEPAVLITPKVPKSIECEVSIKTEPTETNIVELLEGTVGMVAIHPVNGFISSGKVTDENGDPLYGAIVVIKYGKEGMVTDVNGNFRIRAKRSDKIIISAVGYESREVNASTNEQLISLMPLETIMLGIVITRNCFGGNKNDVVDAPDTSLTKDDANENVESVTSAFKIYPNPVAVNANFWMRFKDVEPGDYVMDLLGTNGELIRSKIILIDSKNIVLNENAQTLAAGVYFVRLTNKKTGKIISEKLIVK